MTDVRSSETRTGQVQVGAPVTVNRGTASGDPGASGPDHVFFAAVQLSPVPMIVTDPRQPDNPIVFANAAFQFATGYGADEIISRNCRFLQGADTDPATIRELREAVAARRAFATEILNYRKDGSCFWNALSVTPVFDDAGEVAYFFGSQLDVSRRREAEEALLQAQDGAVGRPTGIAHDFNNLLQVIVGYLELIKSGLAKPDIQRDRLGRSIDNARDAADRATALSQRFLTSARKRPPSERPSDRDEAAGAIGSPTGEVAATTVSAVPPVHEDEAP